MSLSLLIVIPFNYLGGVLFTQASNQCFTLWHEKSKLLKFTFSRTEIEKVSKNELELGDKNFCGILMDWKCDKLATVPFLCGQLKAATDTWWIQTFKTQTESLAEQDILNLIK